MATWLASASASAAGATKVVQPSNPSEARQPASATPAAAPTATATRNCAGFPGKRIAVLCRKMKRVLATGAVLLTAGVASGRGTCAVEGKRVAPIVIDVAPREATAFKLRVEGVPVQVDTGGLEQPAVAHVRGALSFEGTVAAAEIPARTRRAVDALNGMVHL